jgi:ABC-type Mn2+/Zn2+ transport system ATPase subunit
MKDSSMIILENVSAGYGDVIAVRDINLQLEHPFFAVIAGPNGAGKSTLLKLIAGIIRRKSGKVGVFGFDPEVNRKAIRRIISYMPQYSAINQDIPLRVWDVVASPLVLEGRQDIDAIRDSLKMLGVEEYSNHIFSKLSGGLKQRVLLARTLAKRSHLYLLDEPFSHIDPKGRREIISLLYRMYREMHVSFLIVGHDLSICAPYNPYTILINKRIIAYGSFSEVASAKHLAEAYGALLAGEGFIFMGEEHG